MTCIRPAAGGSRGRGAEQTAPDAGAGRGSGEFALPVARVRAAARPAAEPLQAPPAERPARVPRRSRHAVPTPRLTWPRMPWPLEIVACVLGNALYEVVRALVQAAPGAAFQHARQVERLEPAALRATEHLLNAALSAHPLLARLAGYYYTTLHLALAATILVWLWLRHPELYARARTVLVVMTLGALAAFWAYPVAPPRLSVPGMVDTLVQQHIFGAQDGSTAHGLVNLYAAMPSLHVAWGAWCAWAVAAALRTRWRLLAWAYPVLTTLVVLATANHYVLDALAGLAVLALAIPLVPRTPEPAPARPAREPAAVPAH